MQEYLSSQRRTNGTNSRRAAIGLGYLIGPQYMPMDPETHLKESIWVYGLFLDRMSHPVVQEVIKSHEYEMNILHLWRDICKTMDRIMMIDIKPLDLLDSLTNRENNKIEWHGTHTQFFMEMFKDTVNSLQTTEPTHQQTPADDVLE